MTKFRVTFTCGSIRTYHGFSLREAMGVDLEEWAAYQNLIVDYETA